MLQIIFNYSLYFCYLLLYFYYLLIIHPLICFPQIIATIFDKLENLRLSPWLENVGFQHLRVVSLSAMAALSLLWGFLSMLSAEILLMEVVAGETVLVCDAMLQTLLSLDELCISSSSRVQCIKTITLWSTRMW